VELAYLQRIKRENTELFPIVCFGQKIYHAYLKKLFMDSWWLKMGVTVPSK
jgi:hypothetical protein